MICTPRDDLAIDSRRWARGEENFFRQRARRAYSSILEPSPSNLEKLKRGRAEHLLRRKELSNTHWFEFFWKGHMAAELLVRQLSDTAGGSGKKQVDVDTPRYGLRLGRVGHWRRCWAAYANLYPTSSTQSATAQIMRWIPTHPGILKKDPSGQTRSSQLEATAANRHCVTVQEPKVGVRGKELIDRA